MRTISRNNLPIRLPFTQTALAILLMDYYNAPQWLYGVMGCIIVILWIIVLYTFLQEKHENIFEEKDSLTTVQKAEIIERLERALCNSEASKVKSKSHEKLDELKGR